MRVNKKIVAMCLALMMTLCWGGLSLAADSKAAKQADTKKEVKAEAGKVERKSIDKSSKPEPKQKFTKKKTPPKKVNINTASAKELQQLAGVGPKYAKAIVDYRTKNGKFKKAEDIMKVKGIGKKTYGNNKTAIDIK